MQRTALPPRGGVLTTVEADIAGTTTPAGEVWIYTYFVAVNIDGTADATYSLYVTDGTTTLPICGKNTEAKAAGGFAHIEGPEMILPAGWRFRGSASANGDVAITFFGYKLLPDPAP